VHRLTLLAVNIQLTINQLNWSSAEDFYVDFAFVKVTVRLDIPVIRLSKQCAL